MRYSFLPPGRNNIHVTGPGGTDLTFDVSEKGNGMSPMG
jgi:leucyl aminopeptidase (aminopeptidase T)